MSHQDRKDVLTIREASKDILSGLFDEAKECPRHGNATIDTWDKSLPALSGTGWPAFFRKIRLHAAVKGLPTSLGHLTLRQRLLQFRNTSRRELGAGNVEVFKGLELGEMGDGDVGNLGVVQIKHGQSLQIRQVF